MGLQALEGLRVLDLSHVIAGPTASHYLALEGAQVIKVEPPARGDILRGGRAGDSLDQGVSVGFAAINGGKQSLAIDLKQPEGRQILEALIPGCDVFIENYRPGAIARLGFDHARVAALAETRDRGVDDGRVERGAWAQRPAYDHVVQSAMGMSSLQGDADQAPMKVGFPVVDTATGMLAAQAITSALLRRLRTGRGAHLDISMAQSALQLMWPEACKVAHSGRDSARVGNRGFSGSPGAATFECADGWLSTAANTQAQFRAMCGVLGLPRLAEDPELIDQQALLAGGFLVARDARRLHQLLCEAMRRWPKVELESALTAVGVPCSVMRSLGEALQALDGADLMTLPQRHTPYPGGTLRDFAGGYLADGDAGQALGPAPRLGQHTREILLSLGLPAQEIERLHQRGLVRVET